MPTLTAELQAILAVSNANLSPPPYVTNWDFGNPTQSQTVSFFDLYFQATTGGVAVTLPATTVFCVLVQNLHATQTLRVTVTPTGQSASPCIIGPNGIYFYFDPTETGGGITAVTLTGIGGTTPAMIYVGA